MSAFKTYTPPTQNEKDQYIHNLINKNYDMATADRLWNYYKHGKGTLLTRGKKQLAQILDQADTYFKEKKDADLKNLDIYNQSHVAAVEDMKEAGLNPDLQGVNPIQAAAAPDSSLPEHKNAEQALQDQANTLDTVNTVFNALGEVGSLVTSFYGLKGLNSQLKLTDANVALTEQQSQSVALQNKAAKVNLSSSIQDFTDSSLVNLTNGMTDEDVAALDFNDQETYDRFFGGVSPDLHDEYVAAANRSKNSLFTEQGRNSGEYSKRIERAKNNWSKHQFWAQDNQDGIYSILGQYNENQLLLDNMLDFITKTNLVEYQKAFDAEQQGLADNNENRYKNDYYSNLSGQAAARSENIQNTATFEYVQNLDVADIASAENQEAMAKFREKLYMTEFYMDLDAEQKAKYENGTVGLLLSYQDLQKYQMQNIDKLQTQIQSRFGVNSPEYLLSSNQFYQWKCDIIDKKIDYNGSIFGDGVGHEFIKPRDLNKLNSVKRNVTRMTLIGKNVH